MLYIASQQMDEAEALLAKLYINWAVYTCDDVATYDPSMTPVGVNDVIKYAMISSPLVISASVMVVARSSCRTTAIRSKISSMQCHMQNNESINIGQYLRPFPVWPKFNNDGADGKDLFGITLSKNAGGVFHRHSETTDVLSGRR